MEDLKNRLEKVLADADDCELISNLAPDVKKRATFRRLAGDYRAMARRIRSQMGKQEQR
jgi:hypothetical protein